MKREEKRREETDIVVPVTYTSTFFVKVLRFFPVRDGSPGLSAGSSASIATSLAANVKTTSPPSSKPCQDAIKTYYPRAFS